MAKSSIVGFQCNPQNPQNPQFTGNPPLLGGGLILRSQLTATNWGVKSWGLEEIWGNWVNWVN